jgi:hypothetical protein
MIAIDGRHPSDPQRTLNLAVQVHVLHEAHMTEMCDGVRMRVMMRLSIVTHWTLPVIIRNEDE